MKIIIKDSTIVKPASETPLCTLWSSNIDAVTPRLHTPTVYFYKAKEAEDGSGKHIECGHLKEALGRALVPFYPMAGRLKVEEKGRFNIDCNGGGVLFVEATADGCIMEEYGEFFAPCKKMRELVPQIDYSTQSPSSFPLLLVQVTAFRCGGMSLGIGLHHHVADGVASLRFINYWADVARGVEEDDVEPFLDRTLLRARDPPKPEFAHVEYLGRPPLLEAEEEEEEEEEHVDHHEPAERLIGEMAKLNELEIGVDYGGGRPIVTGLFIFSRELVESLKSRAAEHSTSTLPGPDPVPFTTYEVLSAHVWRCACLARKLQDAQLAKLYIATDGRNRLEPPLPKDYFGNVVFKAAPVERVCSIVKGSLADTARQIRKSVLSMDDGYLRSAIDFLELQPNLACFSRGVNLLRAPCLAITSWLRLPFYGADFGWGPPLSVAPAQLACEGMAYFLPGPTGDTRLRCSITLTPQHMRRFRELIYQF